MTEALRPQDSSLEDSLEAHLRWRLRAGQRRVPMLANATVQQTGSAEGASMLVAVTTPSVAGPTSLRLEPSVEGRPGARSAAGGRPAAARPDERGMGAEALEQIREELGACTRCGLHTGRKKIVFGVGSPTADLVFVGEGPGAQEDLQGEPFVGRAGELLTRMIGAMGLSRPEVYICNVVKCRPPGNRDPEASEVAACEPFLKAQLAAIRPRVIVGLGRFAVQSLLGDSRARITRVRGRWSAYDGIALMPTFHPAYLLRNPAAKRETWKDLQAVMARLAAE